MTPEMLGRVVSQATRDAIDRNIDAIAQKVSSVCSDAAMGAAVLAGIQISVDLSVQLILRALETADVIGLPPDDTPIIWVLNGDKENGKD